MTTRTADTDYAWILQELINDVRGTHCAVLAASDGLLRFFAGKDGFSRDVAEGVAAMSTSLLSVSRGIGQALTDSSTVRQVMCELDNMIFYVVVAGKNSVLAVAADRSVDAGRLTHKMLTLARSVSEQLSTAVRPDTPESSGR